MKAFKVACLQYQPSLVCFETQYFRRNELISAKSNLLKYCLSQLEHLDLGSLGQEVAMRDLS